MVPIIKLVVEDLRVEQPNVQPTLCHQDDDLQLGLEK
jgi:hypothetical protein